MKSEAIEVDNYAGFWSLFLLFFEDCLIKISVTYQSSLLRAMGDGEGGYWLMYITIIYRQYFFISLSYSVIILLFF